MVSDPVADMLTRIRNASKAGHVTVAAPGAKMQVEIARVLHEEGYIQAYRVEDDGPGKRLEIDLKPRTENGRAISGLKRISRPGLRVYARKTDIPRVLGGLGTVVMSTSHGLMSGRQALREGLGGEVVCYIW
ncbi:MAG: small subunit ribosomal protein [Chloroflexota bacterium]|jgi:small subunit ribosomal protein S8|nr:small subunit ribosomal protein [Chloroflexota bacterium]